MFSRARRVVEEVGQLILPADLASVIAAQADAWTPKETGGMLLGYRVESDGSPIVVVTDLVDAGPAAKRLRWRFEPDGRWQQRRLENMYTRSGRITTYLGDWHSHPRGQAFPSPTDVRTYAKVATAPVSRTAQPVVMIAATGRHAALRAFAIDPRGRITQLSIRGP